MTHVIGTRAPSAPRKKEKQPATAQEWLVIDTRTGETLTRAPSKYAAKQRAKQYRAKYADDKAGNAPSHVWDKYHNAAPVRIERVK